MAKAVRNEDFLFIFCFDSNSVIDQVNINFNMNFCHNDWIEDYRLIKRKPINSSNFIFNNEYKIGINCFYFLQIKSLFCKKYQELDKSFIHIVNLEVYSVHISRDHIIDLEKDLIFGQS